MATNGAEDKRVISAYLPLSLISALEEKAAREERSFSQTVSRTLRTGLHTNEAR